MNLTPDQRQQVFDAIHGAYTPDALKTMLWVRLSKRLEDLSPMADFTFVLWSVLSRAETEDWLLRLLDAAAAFRPENAALAAFVTSFKAALAPADLPDEDPNPFRASFLRSNHRFPFVDRDTVRAAAQDMYDTRGVTRILVVDGSQKSGKTYTKEFFDFVCSKSKGHKYYYVDFAEDYTPDYTAQDLVTYVVRRMTGADPAPVAQEAQVARWTKLLVEFLIQQATAKQETWWLILDNIGKVTLRDDLRELINRLLKEIDRSNPPLRVVLLNEQTADLAPGAAAPAEEQLALDALDSVSRLDIAPVTKPDIVEYLRKLAEMRQLDLPNETLDATADWVLQQTATPPADQLQYMRRIWTAIAQAHDTILQRRTP